jgi:long-chain acyl-CoA synthetase
MGLSLVELLRNHAVRSPDAPCLSFEGDSLTYRELNERSNRVANALLRQGVRTGDRVAVIARNAPVHFELFFGCAKAAAIMVPINWRLSPPEIAAIVADASPILLLVSEDLRSLLSGMPSAPEVIDLKRVYPAWRDAASSVDPDPSIKPTDATLILYTSGTTGLPKGAMISHESLSYVERMAREVWGFDTGSVNLVAMPLFHIGGIGYGMMALSQGGHTVLLQQPAPTVVIDAIRRHSITHAFFVPAVIQMLVDAPGVDEMNLTSLLRIVYGASPISEKLLKRAIAVFGCGFNHAYGMTETAGTVVTLAPHDHDPGGPLAHRLRSCGLPVPWAELALIDPATGVPVPTGEVGEIRIRSRINMLGYWRKPAETAATITSDGWLCTGDAAYRDADGYVYIHDRYKDMIVSGGENIYPTEIENVLCNHPGVAEVAVIGVPHPRWGETPKAFVVAASNSQASEAELIAYARSCLAHYKCPTSIAFVAALPRNASGKILKREMRDETWMRGPV